jgi:hypothetical protein
MADGDYWLAKTSSGWTVEDRRQVLALHPTQTAALAHLARLANTDGEESLIAQARALPDMPQSDAFFRRFS